MTRRLRRRGVSLLEVMFAIAVAAVGLLGVMVLVPVGLYEVGRGNTIDRGSRLAANAANEFRTRGFANTSFWCTRAGASVALPAPLQWKRAFAIDPQFIAANATQTTTSFLDPDSFPYLVPQGTPLAPSIPSQPRMHRVTVRPWSDTVAPTLNWADQLCLLDDELVFDIPAEKTLPPVQKYSFLNSSAPAKRESDFAYSWMATLTPKLDTNVVSPRDAYVLSIVVFHKRDAIYAMYDDVDGDSAYDVGEEKNEVVVEVSDFPGTGYRGGDVVLYSSSAEALSVRRGSWLMLMGWLADGTPPSPMFSWYRVVDADSEPIEEPPGSGKYYLDVTLHGADWPYASMALDPSTSTKRTFAAIIPHVMTVYEKTVQLESSSMHSFW